MGMTKVVGVCSICGGDVTVPAIWHGTVPAKPTCQNCGAQAARGPVIPMEPAPPRQRGLFPQGYGYDTTGPLPDDGTKHTAPKRTGLGFQVIESIPAGRTDWYC